MASIKTTIQIEVTTNNPFELKPKTEALKQLSKLDSEVLQKLGELSKSTKAVEQLKNNFGMIKGFLG